MKRYLAAAVSALAVLAPSAAVHASGDYSCSPVWKLANGSYGCNDSAVLAPGNDTRVNLFYLLRDRQGVGTAGLSYLPRGEGSDLGAGHNFLTWDDFAAAFYRRGTADAAADDQSGSRCISLASGDQVFAAAMQASRGLPASERAALQTARGNLAQTCSAGGGQGAPPNWPTVASAPAREFLGYLKAANAFYAGDWNGARQGFGGLKSSRDPWLAETAAYMLPRTELNAAQVAAFDEYGSFEAGKADRAALERARAGFGAYLRRYANGRYAVSAGGLVRRTMWLGDDIAGLSREYERLLAATPVASEAALGLVQEVDNKLLIEKPATGTVDGPLLLATIDLMMMRDSQSDEGDTANADRPALITAAQIAAQAPRFSGRADLFGFVQANHAFYVQKDMRRVLQLLPDQARQSSFTPVQFSRQVLRGQALSAVGDRNTAGFWREMLGGATALYQRPVVELGLALEWERGGHLADVFAPGSPIGESSIREILLANVAAPGLLRAQARRTDRPQHERDIALFTLLHKELLHGDYAGFLGDVALIRAGAATEGATWDLYTQQTVPVGMFRAGAASDGYPCAPLGRTVAALARNPRDAKALLCLGEFYRLKGFDDYGRYGTAPKPDELGGTASQFPGRMTTRASLYDAVVADPAAAAGEKAYALYRAVYCYAPNGSNSCGGADVAKSQRQAWFQRLKRDYPASEWAKNLRYYW